MGEPIAVVLGPDEVGDEVVAQRRPSSRDEVLEVGIELIPCPKDRGSVLDDVPIEDLLDVVGPVAEQLPVLGRCAQ